MRIAYVFASRSRPDKFFKALDNIQDMSESKDYFVWAKLDEDDQVAEDYRKRLSEYPEVTVKWGLSKGKIHAINRNLEDLPPCDIIVMMSDDIVWDVYGFDSEIRSSFEKKFPEFDGTVHFPDDHGGRNTIIVSILGRKLYDKLGYLYWEEYSSVFADNDFTETTKIMGCYRFVDKRLFTHLHPIWSLSDWDEQYRRTEAQENYIRDGAIFNRRKSQNFGL